MGKYGKLAEWILQGTSDANVGFDDLRVFLLRYGFVERIRGSHHLFRKTGVEDKINLEREGAKAKPYQVRQVRAVLIKCHMAGGE